MRALVFFALAATATAQELACPTPSTAQTHECFDSVMASAACCSWDQEESLVGSSFIVNFSISMGADPQLAQMASLIGCDTIVTDSSPCMTKVGDHPLLSSLFTSDTLIVRRAKESYVAMLCTATCKSDAGSQQLFEGSDGICGPSVPAPNDPQSVYDCVSTTGGGFNSTSFDSEQPEASTTTHDGTSPGATITTTTRDGASSGATAAEQLELSGASEAWLHHVAALAAAALVAFGW